MKHELQNIISGKNPVRHGDAIQKISSYFRRSKSTSKTFESCQQIKSEEATLIKQFCDKNSFWITAINTNAFVSSGEEQKVYLYNKHKVIKLNDSIYHEKTNVSNRIVYFHVLKNLYGKSSSLDKLIRNISYEIVAQQLDSNIDLVAELNYLNSNNKNFTKDVMKYKITSRNKKNPLTYL